MTNPIFNFYIRRNNNNERLNTRLRKTDNCCSAVSRIEAVRNQQDIETKTF